MDLDAIEQRTRAATQGPWESEDHTHGMKGCRCLSCDVTPGWSLSHAQTCDETDQASGAYDGGCAGPVLSFEDAEFCAHARTDVPDLIARVRELEEENTGLRADLEAATVFRIGDAQVHKVDESLTTGSPGKWHVAISPTSPRWVPSFPYGEADRDAALARARDIAKEDT